MNTIYELAPEQVRRTIDPQTLGMETTEQIAPTEGIIGQQRAVAALQFGLASTTTASTSTWSGRRAAAR